MLLHRHLKIHLVLFSEQIAVSILKDNKKHDTGRDIPIHTKHMGSEVQLHSFSTSTLDGDKGSGSWPRHVISTEKALDN
jgi:hypothetical protein